MGEKREGVLAQVILMLMRRAKALGMEASVDLNEGRRGKVVLAQLILILMKKEVNIKYIFIFF